MKRKNIKPVIILIIIVIISEACEREFSWGTKIGNITYAGNVVFLGPEELSLLKEVTSNEISFTDLGGEIGKITEKSILVVGVSEKTPYGLLRKVNSIEQTGTGIAITTSDALLSDAVKEGSIKLQKRLIEKDFRLKSKVEGVLVKGPDKSFDGLAVTLENLAIYTDGTKVARLEGAVGISPEIDITIEIRFNEIGGIDIVTTLNKIDELTISSNGAFDGAKEIVAAEFIHTPIIIDSLVFVPEVTISCGYEGAISSEVSSGVRQDRVITSRLHYANSRWSDYPLTHTEIFDFLRPQVTDNSDLEFYSGPEITIRLFGVPIQTVKSAGFCSLEAQKTGSPAWKLLIGNEGQNTVIGNIFGLKEDYTSSMNIQASEIGNANEK